MIMRDDNPKYQIFHKYFADWIETYKRGAIRTVTYQKYLMTLLRLTELAPTLRICDINKRSYQALINEYALTHEKQTTRDFHRHLRATILDIVDEGLLATDPTRKAVIKGKAPSASRNKYLNQSELQSLLENLNLESKINWDWFILLTAKTGLRFSEALGLTPNDFDFERRTIRVTKTWNYRAPDGGFTETKNHSSKRIISLDTQLNSQFSALIKGLPADEPVFVQGRVFNDTVNNRLKALCKKADVPMISMHGLRHTHASFLIYAGVSIASVSKRLGHSNITTTQEVYLHIIKELEDEDNEKITTSLSRLGC